jgi:hypothetical protein
MVVRILVADREDNPLIGLKKVLYKDCDWGRDRSEKLREHPICSWLRKRRHFAVSTCR